MEFFADRRPWKVPCDLAFPCATQNEIDEEDAALLIDGGCRAVAEGANMPSTPAAIEAFRDARVLLAPSKAANAGGVAVSGLEMSQNSQRTSWNRGEVNQRLRDIMRNIHHRCVEYGTEDNYVNYSKGANVAGFIKVADAMIAHGIL